MYFAMDKSDVSRLSQQLFEQWQTSPDEWNWYGLLDTGFDYGRRHAKLSTQAWPLYFQPEWGDLRDLSPVLLPCPRDDMTGLQKLIGHAQGRPMLSFIASCHDAESLCEAWQSSLSMVTPDGEHYLLRFADTRITMSLPQVLSPTSWQRLFAPLKQWQIITRSGHLQVLPSPSLNTVVSNEIEWELTHSEFTALLQAAQPDILADQLHDNFPEILPESGAQLYDWLQRSCRMLSMHHIENEPDQLALAVAVCCSQGKLLQDPLLASTLEMCATPTNSLDERLAALLENYTSLPYEMNMPTLSESHQ